MVRLRFKGRPFAIFLGITLLITPTVYYFLFHSPRDVKVTVYKSPDETLYQAHYKQLAHIRTLEHRERKTWSTLPGVQQEALSHFHHRDLALHYLAPQGLLPPSKQPQHVKCLGVVEQEYSAKTTVLLCFKNEVMFLLYRTIITIALRTPPTLLHEILLVDDGSDTDERAGLQELGRVLGVNLRILRHETSVGIADARWRGIRAAGGDVVVILDSHMEVSELWLEPLLDILGSNPVSLAVPLVHLLAEQDYSRLQQTNIHPYGIQMSSGYDMLQLYYTGPPQDTPTQPYPSASIGGGALAAHKTTLLQLYPPALTKGGWGVENNRLALRAWLCGGGVWVSPCSQVLHVNGNDVMLTRYTKDTPGLFRRLKSETLAEIMNFIKEPDERMILLAGISGEEQTLFKEVNELAGIIKGDFDYSKCPKDYDWYIHQVHKADHYKSFNTHHFLYVGEYESAFRPNWCLHVPAATNQVEIENVCRRSKVFFNDKHLVAFTRTGSVRVGGKLSSCWDLPASRTTAVVYGCHEKSVSSDTRPGVTQVFSYEGGSIRHEGSGRCLTVRGEGVVFEKCSGEEQQKWVLHQPRWRKNFD